MQIPCSFSSYVKLSKTHRAPSIIEPNLHCVLYKRGTEYSTSDRYYTKKSPCISYHSNYLPTMVVVG